MEQFLEEDWGDLRLPTPLYYVVPGHGLKSMGLYLIDGYYKRRDRVGEYWVGSIRRVLLGDRKPHPKEPAKCRWGGRNVYMTLDEAVRVLNIAREGHLQTLAGEQKRYEKEAVDRKLWAKEIGADIEASKPFLATSFSV